MWHSAFSVAGLVFLLLFLASVALYFLLRAGRRRMHTLRRLHSAYAEGGKERALREGVEFGELFERAVNWQARRMRAGRPTAINPSELRAAVTATGLNELEAYTALRFIQIATTAIGAIAGFLAGGVLRLPPILPVAFGALTGYVLPMYVSRKIVARRKSRIYRELPAALDLLIVSLEAGLGIAEAIRFVGRETQRQGRLLGQELSTVGAEMAAGVSLAGGLHNLEDRTGVEEIKSLVALLIQSDKVGGRLAPALRASGDLLRTKRRMRAEEAAHRNAIKMLIPLVLMMLPAMMIIIAGPALIQIFQVLGKTHG